jgi:cytochrome P450
VSILEGLFALRRSEPTDDLVGRLVQAEGNQVKSTEMLGMARLLLIAGFETTVNLIGNAVNALLDNPEQWAALCADPAGLAAGAVEETLRFDPPVQQVGRYALEPVELEGESIRQGQFVLTLIGAANRDPQVYPDPNRFNINREQLPDHLAFSSGIHNCIGRPLAVAEATIALRSLAERMPYLRRAGAPRRRAASNPRGLVQLPVRTDMPFASEMRRARESDNAIRGGGSKRR